MLPAVERSIDDAPQANAASVGPTDVGVYAEWEKREPGNIQLPPGSYCARFSAVFRTEDYMPGVIVTVIIRVCAQIILGEGMRVERI
jgi:hypothetical protein